MRTGPRHAAPRRPLLTRLHMPTGKAMAMAAMPTAVIVGMGFTASLAVADNNKVGASSAETMKAEDYQACVDALKADKDKSAESPSPSASVNAPESAKESSPSPSASATGAADDPSAAGSSSDKAPSDKTSSGKDKASSDKAASGASSSSDSGSDDKDGAAGSATGSKGGAATVSPGPSATGKKSGGLLDTIGDTIGEIGNILTGGNPGSGGSSSPSTSPTPSVSASPSSGAGKGGSDNGGSDTGGSDKGGAKDAGSADKGASDTAEDTTRKAAGTVKDVTDTASKAAGDAKKKAGEAAGAASTSPSPSPSASASVDLKDCPAATDAQGGVDNKMPLPDDPWYLDASKLTLKGADYKGVVEVRTANGTTKKVLKYVISSGTEIVDLHQTVKDKMAGKTYHVQSSKGQTSEITGGDTVMYTESISGNLLGLLHVTFSPDSPPPLNIPWILFTKVKVVQAGQFGGTLTIPGMHVYTTDGV